VVTGYLHQSPDHQLIVAVVVAAAVEAVVRVQAALAAAVRVLVAAAAHLEQLTRAAVAVVWAARAAAWLEAAVLALLSSSTPTH
jgi:hypothetical protein